MSNRAVNQADLQSHLQCLLEFISYAHAEYLKGRPGRWMKLV
jgi:hypothetical protein